MENIFFELFFVQKLIVNTLVYEMPLVQADFRRIFFTKYSSHLGVFLGMCPLVEEESLVA
jgi:hypothetical protein